MTLPQTCCAAGPPDAQPCTQKHTLQISRARWVDLKRWVVMSCNTQSVHVQGLESSTCCCSSAVLRWRLVTLQVQTALQLAGCGTAGSCSAPVTLRSHVCQQARQLPVLILQCS
jgi:hypothetical protein